MAWYPALALAAVVAILVLTLVPGESGPVGAPAACLACGTALGADMLLNVLLYIPLGFILHRAGVRGWVVVVFALATSTGVELSQALLPGRFPSILDVLLNILGAGLGVTVSQYSAAHLLGSWRTRVLALAWGGVIAGIVAVTGWAAVPAPPDSVYYGQWTAELGHLGHYGGRVLSATLGPVPIDDGRLESTSSRLRDLIGERAPLNVRLEAGPGVTGLAPIVSVFDEHQREVLLLGVDREDVVFRRASRGEGVGLRSPEYRLPGGALALEAGRTAHLRVARDRSGGVCILIDGAGRCGIATRASSGWALLVPESWRHGLPGTVAGGAWLALLALPVGVWGGATRFAVVGLATAAGAVVAGPWLEPAGLHGPELVALTAGTGLGVWIHAAVLKREAPGDAASPEATEAVAPVVSTSLRPGRGGELG